MPEKPSDKLLLVGGGVGTAPMLYLGEQLAKNGSKPTFLLGARSNKDLLQLEDFAAYGEVYTTTEDGSHGDSSNSDISENIAGDWRLGQGGVCTEHLAERRTAIENMATEGNDRI